MDSNDTPKGFKSALKKARIISQDLGRAQKIIEDAKNKAEHQKRRISEIRSDLENLIRLTQAWLRGKYKKVPLQTIILALAGIIYFLNPFDLVHDYLPALGYFDDMTVIAFIIKSIRQDIEEFLIWEKHSGP